MTVNITYKYQKYREKEIVVFIVKVLLSVVEIESKLSAFIVTGFSVKNVK